MDGWLKDSMRCMNYAGAEGKNLNECSECGEWKRAAGEGGVVGRQLGGSSKVCVSLWYCVCCVIETVQGRADGDEWYGLK